MFSRRNADSNIESAYKYCEAVTRKHAKSFYFAARFLPKDKQKAVFPIYAFCRKVDDEIDESAEKDKQAAIRAVENWKAKLNFVYAEAEKRRKGEKENQRRSSSPHLPISSSEYIFLAWQDLLTNYKIPQNLPLELIEGVLMDTHIKRYATFEELYMYCYRVASTVGLMSSEILGYSDKKALEYAEAMGIGMQLTNILRDVKEDARMGRIYLPQEDLETFGVSESQIFSGEWNENFVELMKFQISRARDFYRTGEKGIKLLEKDSRFTVLLASRIYVKILDEIEKQNYDVFKRRAHTTKTQKIFAMPRIWLESKK